ncbi:MAG: hypothetical protein WKF84_15500 [Pyrinomonadaceae bacterium]
MTSEEAQQFRDRWRLVNEMASEEGRQRSASFKLQQLGAMYSAYRSLGWSDERADKAQVRERWRRLREKLNG